MPPPLPSPREADAFQGTTNRKCLSPFIHTTRLSKAIFSEPCPITAAVLRGPHSLTCQMLRKLGLCPRLVPSSALSSRGHWIQCSLSASYFLAPQVVSCNQWSPKQFITFLSCPPPHAPSCWWHYRFLCARAGSSWVSLDSLFSHSSSKLTAESCGMSFHDVTWICLLLLATVPLPSGLAFLPSLGGSGGGGRRHPTASSIYPPSHWLKPLQPHPWFDSPAVMLNMNSFCFRSHNIFSNVPCSS